MTGAVGVEVRAALREVTKVGGAQLDAELLGVALLVPGPGAGEDVV
jgi:hypothetical protein